MQGTSIAEARNALQLALRSLRPGCLFNIVGFGSQAESLFPESRAYDDASLAEATKHVTQLEADLGGTEILPALERVLDAERRPGLPRQVFVLTDGEVSNTDAVIALGRSHAGHTRIFTFGIGAGASHHLVKGLARAGEGEAEFIAPGERIEAKVLRQLSRALAPALSDVSVDWSGLAVTQAPHEVPPVFAEGRVLLFGRIDTLQAAQVSLRARGPEGDVSFALPLDPAQAMEGTLVGTLWARRMIRDLEEGRSAIHPRRGSQQARALGLQDEKVKAEIVSLGTSWSLVSRHTSFVAVEERATPTQGDAQLRKVPVAITRGWHGIGAVGRVLGLRAAGAGMRASAPALSLDDTQSGVARSMDTFDEDVRFGATRAVASAPRPSSLKKLFLGSISRQRPTSTASTRPLDRLVSLQGADGSWKLDERAGSSPGLVRREEPEEGAGPLAHQPGRRKGRRHGTRPRPGSNATAPTPATSGDSWPTRAATGCSGHPKATTRGWPSRPRPWPAPRTET